MEKLSKLKIRYKVPELFIIRAVLSLLIGIHGWARFLNDGVVPFGEVIGVWGFPFGFWIASGITLVEILGTPLLLVGRLVFPLTLIYSFIYFMGITLIHFNEGWFVVGFGRNGMEYSVLLIACLLVVGVSEMPEKWRVIGKGK